MRLFQWVFFLSLAGASDARSEDKDNSGHEIDLPAEVAKSAGEAVESAKKIAGQAQKLPQEAALVAASIQKWGAQVATNTVDFFNKKEVMKCAKNALYTRGLETAQISELARILEGVCNTQNPAEIATLGARCSTVYKAGLRGNKVPFKTLRARIQETKSKEAKGLRVIERIAHPDIVCFGAAAALDFIVLSDYGGVAPGLGLQVCFSSNGATWAELVPKVAHTDGVGIVGSVRLTKSQRKGFEDFVRAGPLMLDFKQPQPSLAFAGLVGGNLMTNEQNKNLEGIGLSAGLGFGLGTSDGKELSVPVAFLHEDNMRPLSGCQQP